MDPKQALALKRVVKANRLILIAMGALFGASLNATKAMQKLQEEVAINEGSWKVATPQEKDEVDQAVADMVATYASQVN